jgi:hypothetical protein
MKTREVMKSCAWCGKGFDANRNWYKERLPDLCESCRKDRKILNRFKGFTVKV